MCKRAQDAECAFPCESFVNGSTICCFPDRFGNIARIYCVIKRDLLELFSNGETRKEEVYG